MLCISTSEKVLFNDFHSMLLSSLYVLCVLFFFPFVMENERKNCKNAEEGDFDLGTLCEALVRWSKYTTADGMPY